MLGMLARQACRQHVSDRKWHAVEMIKNALNLCDFSNNSRNRSLILFTVLAVIYWPLREAAKRVGPMANNHISPYRAEMFPKIGFE